MPKSRFSPPVVLLVKLVFWSNDQKKHLAGLGLYDVVKSREGGLKGLKATNHMERGRKLVQKYDRPQQWHPVDIRETVVGRAGDRAAGRSGGQPCGWPRGREGEPAKLPGPITILLFHVNVFKACAWSKHSSFLKVKVLNSAPHNQENYVFLEDAQAEPDTHPEGGPVVLSRNPTTRS